MAAAEKVDSDLRSTVLSARTKGLRGIKATVVGRGTETAEGQVNIRSLALASSLEEEKDAALESEFQRCVKLLDADKPGLMLFRADRCENIDGSRWLLLTWLPEVAPAAEKAVYMRSRGLLTDLVTQQYFLSELVASKRQELAWPAACTAMARLGSRNSDNEDSAPKPRRPPTAEAALEAPVQPSPALVGLLQRLVRREDKCLRLHFSRGPSLATLDEESTSLGPAAPVLEGKVVDCRSPAQLAKADLPSGPCFFVLYSRDDLLFVHWCPDRVLARDIGSRMRDDSRYAVLKASVLKQVVAAFPEPGPRLLLVDAREPGDLVDGANRAAETSLVNEAAGKSLMPCASSGYPSSAKDSGRGDHEHGSKGARADWPADWPAEQTMTVSMPAALTLPKRPVPHWRGGSKSHTFESSEKLATGKAQNALSRVKLAGRKH